MVPATREDGMALQLRRVVTGHDKAGKAIVTIDEQVKNIGSARPGAQATVVWSTVGFPIDNDGHEDESTRKVGTTLAGGTVFRVVEFSPGVQRRMHRTDSVDYAVILSGEIDMELDDSTVHLQAGDVLVQRGTIHNWLNRGTTPCTIAFILIDAKPATAGGKVLHADG
jgi:quercetin dioxygenase-like cupin family protein